MKPWSRLLLWGWLDAAFARRRVELGAPARRRDRREEVGTPRGEDALTVRQQRKAARSTGGVLLVGAYELDEGGSGPGIDHVHRPGAPARRLGGIARRRLGGRQDVVELHGGRGRPGRKRDRRVRPRRREGRVPEGHGGPLLRARPELRLEGKARHAHEAGRGARRRRAGEPLPGRHLTESAPPLNWPLAECTSWPFIRLLDKVVPLVAVAPKEAVQAAAAIVVTSN